MKFVVNNFTGGLNTEFDPTKTPADSYPLAIDVRARRNVLARQRGHTLLAKPPGAVQGLYGVGSILYAFIAGVAYKYDTTVDDAFEPVPDWIAMATTGRIYAQLVPANTNLLTRTATGAEEVAVDLTFTGAVNAYPALLTCHDGVNKPQGIGPTGTAIGLGEYSSWTPEAPLYVPIGILPATSNTKLMLVSPDGKLIYQSVTGRCTDFGVNVTNAGALGGDVETTSLAVSGNTITALFSADNGGWIAGTLFGTFLIEETDATPIFGEPVYRIRTLFSPGPVNEKSVASANGDTVFISQTGLHSFNLSFQLNFASNNDPFSRPVRDLFASAQQNTCAVNFNDYAMFGMDTRFGRGVFVFDNTVQRFVSLDLSFGDVQQFAVVHTNGIQRLFFYTSADEIYEAFAADTYLPGQVYLGEFNSQSADAELYTQTLALLFSELTESGNVYVDVYVDGVLSETIQNHIEVAPVVDNGAVPTPSRKNVQTTEFQLKKLQGWKIGLMIRWTVGGALNNVVLSTTAKEDMRPQSQVTVVDDIEEFILLGNTFTAPNPQICAHAETTRGNWYLFSPSDRLVKLTNGNKIYTTRTVFQALGESVRISVPADETYELWDVTDLVAVAQFAAGKQIIQLGNVGAGNNLSNLLDNLAALAPAIFATGPRDINIAEIFYGQAGQPSIYPFQTNHIDGWVYSHGLTVPAAALDSNGEVAGPSIETKGWLSGSIQDKMMRQAREQSAKPFKFTFCGLPAYDDTLNGGGYTQLRHIAYGAQAVFSGGAGEYSLSTVAGKLWANIPWTSARTFGHLRVSAAHAQLDIRTVDNIVAGTTINRTA